MSTKHTPGPWSIWNVDNDETKRIIVADEGDTEVCGLVENLADAKLITAAPDLLEALEEIQTLWEKGLTVREFGFHLGDLMRNKGRAAIAKAKGQD